MRLAIIYELCLTPVRYQKAEKKAKKTDRKTDMYDRNTHSMQSMLELLKKQFHVGNALILAACEMNVHYSQIYRHMIMQ